MTKDYAAKLRSEEDSFFIILNDVGGPTVMGDFFEDINLIS